MSFLHNIDIILPNTHKRFQQDLFSFLSHFGEVQDSQLSFTQSNTQYLPHIHLRFEEYSMPIVQFFSEGHPINIQLVNKTGVEKKSKYTYKHIEITNFLERMKDVQVLNLDHIGFDIPWFEGIHPEIIELREALKDKSLYHLFPTGEPWDFIIPGSEEEIERSLSVDYAEIRKPKFEIVSLDTVSTPIIQFDFSVKNSFSELATLFPEAIHIEELKNIWVYIKNPYGVDICFVVNEYEEGDWSNFFSKNRI